MTWSSAVVPKVGPTQCVGRSAYIIMGRVYVYSALGHARTHARTHAHTHKHYCRVTWGKAPPRGKAPPPLSNYEFTHASGSIS